jgi:hypothetical protein
MYRKYKGPFSDSGQTVWLSYDPLAKLSISLGLLAAWLRLGVTVLI